MRNVITFTRFWCLIKRTTNSTGIRIGLTKQYTDIIEILREYECYCYEPLDKHSFKRCCFNRECLSSLSTCSSSSSLERLERYKVPEEKQINSLYKVLLNLHIFPVLNKNCTACRGLSLLIYSMSLTT